MPASSFNYGNLFSSHPRPQADELSESSASSASSNQAGTSATTSHHLTGISQASNTPAPEINQNSKTSGTLSQAVSQLRLHLMQTSASPESLDNNQVTKNDLVEWINSDTTYSDLSEPEILMRADLAKRLDSRQPNSEKQSSQVTTESTFLTFPGVKTEPPIRILEQASELIHNFKIADQGALDLTSKDAQGKTLTELAQEAGYIECAEFLNQLTQPVTETKNLVDASLTELFRLIFLLSGENTSHPLIQEAELIRRNQENVESLQTVYNELEINWKETTPRQNSLSAIEQLGQTIDEFSKNHDHRCNIWRAKAISIMTSLGIDQISNTSQSEP